MTKFVSNSLLDFLQYRKIFLGKGVGRALHTRGYGMVRFSEDTQSRDLCHLKYWYLKACAMGGRKMVRGIDKRGLYSDPNR